MDVSRGPPPLDQFDFYIDFIDCDDFLEAETSAADGADKEEPQKPSSDSCTPAHESKAVHSAAAPAGESSTDCDSDVAVKRRRLKVKLAWSRRNERKKINARGKRLRDAFIQRQLDLAKFYTSHITTFFNSGDLKGLGKFYGDYCVPDFEYVEEFRGMLHPVAGEMGMVRSFRGVENFQGFIESYVASVPDSVITLRQVEVMEEGYLVVCKCSTVGTVVDEATELSAAADAEMGLFQEIDVAGTLKLHLHPVSNKIAKIEVLIDVGKSITK